MAVLNYWICECLRDSSAYNLRGKTKKAVLALREEYGVEGFGDPQKRTIYYDDAFDLMDNCLGENRGGE